MDNIGNNLLFIFYYYFFTYKLRILSFKWTEINKNYLNSTKYSSSSIFVMLINSSTLSKIKKYFLDQNFKCLVLHFIKCVEMNWDFPCNSDFLIPKSLQCKVIDLSYFKLWILLVLKKAKESWRKLKKAKES